MNDSELIALRKRVKLQRRELRRLNKVLGAFWQGVRFAHSREILMNAVRADGSKKTNEEIVSAIAESIERTEP